jgi:hypothetical protein
MKAALQAAEKLIFLKGTAFRPYANAFEMRAALAAEASFRLEPALFPQPVQPVHRRCKSRGLYRLQKNSVLYQGTTLVVP